MAKVISQLPSGGSVPKHNNLLGLNEGDYLHLTQFEKAKLDGIQSGAEVNVNADWNAISGDAQILNKPASFPPSAHTHTISEITDFPTFKTIEGQSIIGTGNIDLDKNIVGLGNVDNTSDLLKPISTATQIALNTKEPAIASGTISQYWRGDKTWQEFPTIQTIDNIPTDGSNNAVSSNGVFDALASKAPISSVHNPVTIGTANGLSLSTQQLSLGLASSGATGALSGTDWNNFNSKFNTPTGLTTNYLPKWNGSGFGNSNIFDNGTNIGIGTTNPTANLTVKGAYSVGSSIPANWALLSAGRMGVANNNKGLYFDIFNGYAEVSTYDWGLGQAYPMVFQGNGGNSMFGTNVDNGSKVQVNGTISASPATTANQVVVKSQLDSKASLSGATFTGDVTIPIARLDKLYLKSSPSNPDLSAIIAISKNINAVTSHIIEDSSTITPPSGADGYGLVDMVTTVNGSNPATHVHAYQSRITYTSSANMPTNNFSSISSFYSENRISGTGVVDKVIGLKVVDTYMAQANKINKQYGVLIENQTVGAINYGIWNDTRGNYMKGLSIGTDTIDLSNALNVNGTIVASPATTANQVVVKSQLDAVAATSGTYTPTLTNIFNCTSLSVTNAVYTKIGNIVTVTVGYNSTSVAASSMRFSVSLPFNRTSSTANNMGTGAANAGTTILLPIMLQSTSVSTVECTIYSSTIDIYKGAVTFQYTI